MRRIGTVALTAAIVMLLTSPPARAESETTVKCGQVVTRTIRLANDLRGCRVDGLVVGAGGITIDLNGHTLDGTSAAGPKNPHDCFCGVNVGEYAGVTVTNGNVTDFVSGVEVFGDRATIAGINATHMWDAGAMVRGGDGTRVVHQETDDAYWGVFMREASHASVTGARVTRVQHSGIALLYVADVLVTASDVDGQWAEGEADWGLEAISSTRVAFTHNTVRHIGGVGIGVGTRLRGTADGVEISGNVVSLSATGIGATTRAPGEPGPGDVLHVTISGNVVFDNREDGINIDVPHQGVAAKQTTITDNTVVNNAWDGINVHAPSTTIGANNAWSNGRLGIRAVRGVTDGGRNRAWHNGDARQCIGVSCQTS
ncbi:MAG: large repetitive protein [Actinomycetota bacterium]|jgi:hypothetical protein